MTYTRRTPGGPWICDRCGEVITGQSWRDRASHDTTHAKPRTKP